VRFDWLFTNTLFCSLFSMKPEDVMNCSFKQIVNATSTEDVAELFFYIFSKSPFNASPIMAKTRQYRTFSSTLKLQLTYGKSGEAEYVYLCWEDVIHMNQAAAAQSHHQNSNSSNKAGTSIASASYPHPPAASAVSMLPTSHLSYAALTEEEESHWQYMC